MCVQNKKNTSENKTIREVFDSLGSIRGQIILPYDVMYLVRKMIVGQRSLSKKCVLLP